MSADAAILEAPGRRRPALTIAFRLRAVHLLILPAILYLLAFCAFPAALWLSRAFFDPGPTLQNVHHLIEQPVYLRVLLNTLKIALAVTVLCLVVGYPLAYTISAVDQRYQPFLLLFVLLPFWTSSLVRSFSWIMLLSPVGPIDAFLSALHPTKDPVPLMGNTFGVLLGMVNVLLPYAILTMFAGMQGIDRRLVRAASTLGATPIRQFTKVYLPLSLPGATAAGFLVFIDSLGFFITPALLGGPRDAMIAESIQQQIGATLNWGFAALLGLGLLLTTLVMYVIYARVVGLESLWGAVGGDRLASHEIAGRAPRLVAWAQGARSRARDRYRGATVYLFRPVDSLLGEPWVARWGRRLIVTGPAYLVLVFLLIPVVLIIPMSFNSSTFFGFPFKSFSIRWYQEVLTSERWTSAGLASLEVACLSALVSGVLGVLAAMGLIRLNLRWRGVLIPMLLSPMVIPRMVVAIGVFYWFAKLELVQSVEGMVLAHAALGTPYVVITSLSALQGFDRRLEHAAMTLGANPWRAFWRVVFPLIRAGVFAGLLFAFITSFDDLLVAMFLTGGRFVTLPALMWSDTYLQVRPTLAAVSTVILTVTVCVLMSAFLLRRGAKTSASG